MRAMIRSVHICLGLFLAVGLLAATAQVASGAGDMTGHVPKDQIYDPGTLPPTASELKVTVGEEAPDFTLPDIHGGTVTLSQYRGEKNVVISFVPAAFTPVCSEQWPGYNLAEKQIKERDAIVLGISTDNTPSQHAWCQEMGGVWFPVLSDFFPHGQVASTYGVLRPEGVSERAIFIVDKQGVIRFIEVHDINQRPDIKKVLDELDKLQ